MHSFKQKSEKIAKNPSSLRKTNKLPDKNSNPKQASTKSSSKSSLKKGELLISNIEELGGVQFDEKLNVLERNEPRMSGLVSGLESPGVNLQLKELNSTLNDKNSEEHSEIMDDKIIVQKTFTNNDYLLKLRERNSKKIEKNMDKSNLNCLKSQISMTRDYEREEKGSPIRTQALQKVSIVKNSMKRYETNKVDYGINGMEESCKEKIKIEVALKKMI